MNVEKSFLYQQVGERREQKERIWWFMKSALRVMETSPLLCFAHPARMHNPKMCFFLSPHGFLIQSKEVLCFQIPSLLSQLCSFLQTILVVLNILPALRRSSLRRNFYLRKRRWENTTSPTVLVAPSDVTPRQPRGRSFPDSCVTSGL